MVEVAVDLLVPELGVAGLDLNKHAPACLAALDDDGAVGNRDLALAILELYLGEGRDAALRRTEVLKKGVGELGNRLEDGEESAGGASLLLLLAADPRRRYESRRSPPGVGILSNA